MEGRSRRHSHLTTDVCINVGFLHRHSHQCDEWIARLELQGIELLVQS